jgi:hypothetical protein
VATKISRLTNGSGSTNAMPFTSARVRSAIAMRSIGMRATVRQKRSPLSTAVSFASRPPWLWPTTTMRSSAGSRASFCMRA